MRGRIGKMVGWLAVALLLAANGAYAAGLGASEASVPGPRWTCGEIVDPGGGTQESRREWSWTAGGKSSMFASEPASRQTPPSRSSATSCTQP